MKGVFSCENGMENGHFLNKVDIALSKISVLIMLLLVSQQRTRKHFCSIFFTEFLKGFFRDILISRFGRESFILWHYSFVVELRIYFWLHFYFADFSGETANNFCLKFFDSDAYLKKLQDLQQKKPVIEFISKPFDRTTQYLISVIKKHPLLPLKLQIWCLLQARSILTFSLTFRQTIECMFTLKPVLDMIITHREESINVS